MALGELKNGIGPDAYAIYQQVLAAVVERDHPVGSLYISETPTSPAELYGGTWERIENCTIWGASDTHPAGTKLAAGLPNITGELISRPSGSSGAGGSVTAGYGAFNLMPADAGGKDIPLSFQGGLTSPDRITFDASNVSSIYGASNTVQPPAYCMYIWRRVA